ncbi:hypothetical protein WICMUC_002066 [Wickerhamomyces mucosus]|uniref:AP-2 complex subunit alpha n=1 Tax=Wickerhamomyces mucosus TaxID=1378264 RepID=A0A9P8PRP4_9ASCO|nr:hypothetical protein WICMUC_002066 [Wickerhamomyces mucosus]
MGTPMKGLQQFISDLRSSQSREDEERRINTEILNIQTQFNSNNSQNLTGYQRKKYIAKLIYIYINSSSKTQITFNYHNQILTLLTSNVYSEKFFGYLSINLIFNNDEEFINLIINSIKKDLNSNDINSNLLALSCIATLGNQTFADLLLDDVFKILRSPTSTPSLKKKSSLALLKLLTSDKDLLKRHPMWIPRILSLVDDENLGVLISILPLVEFIAIEIDFNQTQSLIPILTNKLKLLILERDKIPKEYQFNGLSNPWLITKIARILEILLPDLNNIDLNSLRTLRICVSNTVDGSSSSHQKDSAIKNASNAILFSIINLANSLDPSIDAIISSFETITTLLISSNDLNTKYLALNSLISLSSKTENSQLNNIQETHLLKIFQILKDQYDISISKKCLDLIYIIATPSSINYIITEFLKILKTSDHVLKSEISVKISVLSEKFAKEPGWFINTMLELIDLSGPYLNQPIWERIVQIVINNENLQKITCSQLIKYITKSNFQESMVKIASYILGEFGYLIQDELSINKQFEIFAKLYFYVSNNVRTMILLTFVKFLKHSNFDKDLKSKTIKFLRLEINSINAELQQRSYEYLTIISKLNSENGEILFNLIFDEIPVLVKTENPILLKLSKTNPHAKKELVKRTENLADTITAQNEQSTTIQGIQRLSVQNPVQKRESPLTPNWEQGFYRLFEYNQGVFFENSLIKIILRIQKHVDQKEKVLLNFTICNKSSNKITSLITSLNNYKTTEPDLIINTIDTPDSELLISEKTNFRLEVSLRSYFEFNEIPNLKIQFNSGAGFNTIKLKLPIFLKSFIDNTDLSFEQFLKHWKQIETNLNYSFHKIINSKFGVDYDYMSRFLKKLNLKLVQTNSGEFLFSSGILKTTSASFGILSKVKILTDNQIELIIRTTDVKVSELIGESIVRFFEI